MLKAFRCFGRHCSYSFQDECKGKGSRINSQKAGHRLTFENLTASRPCLLASMTRANSRVGPITSIVVPTVIKMAEEGLILDPFRGLGIAFFASVDVELCSAVLSPSVVP